ncbi:MAG: hypothetical protein IPP50_20430 [Piscinibacter sp.]|nr:hypothetical protein [Piscinibacter sp.]
MTQASPRTPTAEYAELKAFLKYFSERFGAARAVAPEQRPLALVEAAERDDPARAPGSLRMAVNDCMELSSHWPWTQVAALDAELHAKGLLSLSQVRQRVWGRYAAIVKHGQVRNDADAQVVRAVLADAMLAAALPEAERATLKGVLAAHDRRRVEPPPPARGRRR